MHSLIAEPEHEHALCFFVSSWVDYSSDLQSERGILEVLPSLYLNTKIGSPLWLSLAAVSRLVFNKFEHGVSKGENFSIRQMCGLALAATSKALQDPLELLTDETLMAVCLLGFYETAAESYKAKISSPRHFEGAAALINQRRGMHTTNLGQKMLTGVRSSLVYRAVQSASPIDVNEDIWADSAVVAHTPATLLDRLLVDVANLLALARQYPRPAPVAATYHVPRSIVIAGFYGKLCDIYQDIMICATWNDWRTARLKVLAINASRKTGSERIAVTTTMQELADEICASIPFSLGSRTTPAPLHTAKNISYTTMPGTETSEMHYRTAAAYGGWYLFPPRKQVMDVGAFIREG